MNVGQLKQNRVEIYFSTEVGVSETHVSFDSNSIRSELKVFK